MSQAAVGTKNYEKELSFSEGFGSFSVDDLQKAKEFYSQTLGLDVTDRPEGLLMKIGGTQIFLYPKDDHEAATFTVLNLSVDDIEKAVDALAERGVEFESYDEPIKTDEKGIFWGKSQNKGPNIAWFKDPAGNILSAMELDL
jgi:catechol 2,3-dioxygenase-like lactoylglutathione lyase family enzyme